MATSTQKILLDCCLILLSAMVFLWPEADPSWLKAANDIHDAAWWADPAKQMIVNGNWMNGPFAGALSVGPLTVLIHFASFKFLGISFFSLRCISLIPAVSAAWWFRFDKQFGVNYAILLLTSTVWFVSARLGIAEVFMGWLLLVGLVLLKNGNAFKACLSAMCFVAGFLLKASFIYQCLLVFPVFILWRKELDRKTIAVFIATILCLIIPYYFFYLQPNAVLFAPFLNEFSSDYFTVSQLLDPSGLWARVVYLTDREFFQHPSVVLMCVALLVQLGSGFTANSRWSFSLLFLLGILFLMPSDFAGRRFIPLFPLLIAAILEQKKKVEFNSIGMLLGALLLNWSSLGALMPNNSIFKFDGAYFHLSTAAFYFLLFHIVAAILFGEANRKKKVRITQYFKYSVMVFALSILTACLRVHFAYSFLLSLIMGASILILIHLFFSNYRFFSLGLVLIVLVGFTLNLSTFFSLSFSERNNAQIVASVLKNENGPIAGNSTTFSMVFLSQCSAMHYPLSESWNTTNPIGFGAYSSTDFKKQEIDRLFQAFEIRFRGSLKDSCTSFRVWKSNETGLFCLPRREK